LYDNREKIETAKHFLEGNFALWQRALDHKTKR